MPRRSKARKKIVQNHYEEAEEESNDAIVPSRRSTRKSAIQPSTPVKKPVAKPIPSTQKRSRKRRAAESSDDEDEDEIPVDEGSSSDSDSDDDVDIDSATEESDAYQEYDEVDAEDDGKKRTYIPRDRDPVYIMGRDLPELKLPPSSEDLLIPQDLVLKALGVYEILRRFSSCIQLTPFRFEDFCGAMVAEENSKLVSEIFSAVIRLIIRDSEVNGQLFSAHDEKDMIYLSSYCTDTMTWPELVRSFLQSSKEHSEGLKIVENPGFPFIGAREKLELLDIICAHLLRLPGVIRASLNPDSTIQHEEACRSCQKPGELICCEKCPATYHLKCVVPELKEIPEGDWLCPVCKSNQVPGVSDSVSETEKMNYFLRQEPLGLDRSGRRFAFIARRLFIYSEDESEVYYYSTVPQFQQVISLLHKQDYEKELYEALEEMKEKICEHMEITAKLTRKFAYGKQTYFDQVNALITEELKKAENGDMEQDVVKVKSESKNDGESGSTHVEDHEPRATRLRTGVIPQKTYSETSVGIGAPRPSVPAIYLPNAQDVFDLSKVGGQFFKLGMEGTFRQYRNHYVETSALALTKAQKADERDKKRHLAAKFNIFSEKLQDRPGASGILGFNWIGLSLGISTVILKTLRDSVLALEKSTHEAFFHPVWKSVRSNWAIAISDAKRPEDLAIALTKLESCLRPIVFQNSWHENLGCVRWSRLAALDREESRNLDRRRKREEEEQQVSRSTKGAYVNFSQGVSHQIWKHKGEEFRLSGKGGVYWWSKRLEFGKESKLNENPAADAKVPERIKDTPDVIDISAALSNSESPFFPTSKSFVDVYKAADSLAEKLSAGNRKPATEAEDVKSTAENEQPNKDASTSQPASTENEKKDVMVVDKVTEASPVPPKPVADEKKPSQPFNAPKLLEFNSDLEKEDFYHVPETEFKLAALGAGQYEVTGYKYEYKLHPHWEYSYFPRPNFRTAWRFRTYSVKTWGGAALQFKILVAGLKMNEMTSTGNPDGYRTIQTDHEHITAQVVNKRPSPRITDFPRFEYLVKKNVRPIHDGNSRYHSKSTPGRSGLRERKVETPRRTGPYEEEHWVQEEELELWEIKSFHDRIENPPPFRPKPVNVQTHPGPNIRTLSAAPARSGHPNFIVSKGNHNGNASVMIVAGSTTPDGKQQYVLLPGKNAQAPGPKYVNLGTMVGKDGSQTAVFAVKQDDPSAPMSFIVQAGEPGTDAGQEAQKTMTQEELNFYINQLTTGGGLSADALARLQSLSAQGVRLDPKLADVRDPALVAYEDRATKRLNVLRKYMPLRIDAITEHHKEQSANSMSEALKNIVMAKPELVIGLPTAPKPVIPETPVVQRKSGQSRGRPRPKSPKKESEVVTSVAVPTPATPKPVPVLPAPIQPAPAPVVPAATVPPSPAAPAVVPSGPPLSLRLKKVQGSPSDGEVAYQVRTKAKMISTAPPESTEPKIKKKPGRKKNSEILAAREAEAMRMAAESAVALGRPEPPKIDVKSLAPPVRKPAAEREVPAKRKVPDTVEETKVSPVEKKTKAAEAPALFSNTPARPVAPPAPPQTVLKTPARESSPKVARKRIQESVSNERKSKNGSAGSPKRKKMKLKNGSGRDEPVEEKEGELHCYCQQPYDVDRFYICCDKCDKWFHGDCVGIKENDPKLKNVKWYCPDCRKAIQPPSAKPVTPPTTVVAQEPPPNPPRGRGRPKRSVSMEESAPSPLSDGPAKSESIKLKIKLPPPPPAPTVETPQPQEPLKVRFKRASLAAAAQRDVLEEASSEPVATNGRMTNGHAEKTKATKKNSQKAQATYCYCQQPEKQGNVMVQCDKCKEWYHPRCLAMNTVEATSVKKLICPSCTRDQSVQAFLFKPVSKADQNFFRKTLDNLMKNKKFDVFREPVRDSDVPDYRKIVTQPMSLREVSDNLNRGSYKTPGQLITDVGLIVDNCRYYNGDSSDLTKSALDMEKYFVQRIKEIRQQSK